MKLTALTLFRMIIMLACAIMLAVALADAVDMGPRQLQKAASLNKVIAVSALRLAGMFVNENADRSIAGLQIYLGLLGLAFSVFAAAIWGRTSPQIKRSASLDAGLLAVQILVGALVESDLLYLVAAELAFVLPLRTALAWLCAQMLTFIVSTISILMHTGAGTPRCNIAWIFPPPAIVPMGLDWIEEIAFQIFAFCVGYFAGTEMRSRLALASAHAELVAAQMLLEDAIRASEQERIAHNLHTAISDQLSALCLQLDLAMRHASAHIVESVRTSRELAQRLLAEVRIVVSGEREQQPIHVRHALETLCAGIPYPRIVLSYDEQIDLNSPALAHTIFRVVQEAVSNTVRHSGASLLQIAVGRQNEGLIISIDDNGNGVWKNVAGHAGNGLRGICERIEAHGGTLKTANRSEGGFSMQIRLPQSRGGQ